MLAERRDYVVLVAFLFANWCTRVVDGSFCDLCERPEESGVSTCECYQFCCANGHTFDNPSVCALMAEGAKCDDPCARCAELHTQPEAQENCFHQCCRVDYFADSCRAWRFSAAEIYVSGTKVVTDRRITPDILAGRAQPPTSYRAHKDKTPPPQQIATPARGNQEQNSGGEDTALSLLAAALSASASATEEEATTQLEVLAKRRATGAGAPTKQEVDEKLVDIPCSYVDSNCDAYCRGFDKPHEPIHTTCPRQDIADGACGGWACSHTSKGRAQDGCFCCCSRLTDTDVKDNSDDEGSGEGSVCAIGHDENRCADFCAAQSPSFLPLTCREGDEQRSHHCGGHVCQVSDSDAAQNGCFCCCANPTNEWQKVSGDALPPAESRPSVNTRASKEVDKPDDPLDGCPNTDACAEYCSGFGEFMNLHSVCRADEEGDKNKHCGGWACENTSSSRAPDGCFCCCSSSSGNKSARNGDECEVGHADNKCEEFCGRQHPEFLTFSCSMSDGSSGGGCGGHLCAATSETDAQDGCYCCCASNGVDVGRVAGNSVTEERVAAPRASSIDALDMLAIALAGEEHTQALESPDAAPADLGSPDENITGNETKVTAKLVEGVVDTAREEKGGCDMTEECHSFCDGFRDPLEPVHAVCPSVRGSTRGLTCAGWGCSYASKSVGAQGCTCCCANYGMVPNGDRCSVAARTGRCLAYCASFMRNYMPLSCELEALAGTGPTSAQCGGSQCVEGSEEEAEDGCFCCCAES